MAKVLVERPRVRRPPRGEGSPYPRAKLERLFARRPEEAWTQVSMRARHRDKQLNEYLAPLRRFLHAQVGRPWRLVYAEMTAHIRVTSAVQAHIKQHIGHFVEVSPCFVDGVPHRLEFGGLQPLARWHDELYVCPRSGLLRLFRRAPEQRPRYGRVISLDARHELREVDGVWKHVTLARRPQVFARGQLFDVLLGQWLDPAWFELRNGYAPPPLIRYRALFGRDSSYAVSLRAPGVRERARIDAVA